MPRAVIPIILAGAISALTPGLTAAQGLRAEVPARGIGLQGYVEPGAWTPLLVELSNDSAERLDVICRWRLRDQDGDTVIAERRTPVEPQQAGQRLWLYARVPANQLVREAWRVEVVDAATGDRLVEPIPVGPNRERLLTEDTGAIGVCGGRRLGLDPYTVAETRQEPQTLITSLSIERLPDRWYGMQSLRALVWSSPSGGAGDPLAVPRPVQQALREWVYRGGHLVLVLPGDQTWSASAMSDLLPVPAGAIQADKQPDYPVWVGLPAGQPQEIDAFIFDTTGSPGTEVLLRGRPPAGTPVRADGTLPPGPPLVVSKRFGFGRVTAIGVDLTLEKFWKKGLPRGPYGLWNAVFTWQSPGYPKADLDNAIDPVGFNARPTIARANNRSPFPLDAFVPGELVRQTTVGSTLLLAVLLFSLYWLFAGPVLFLGLKGKQATRHAWVGFVLVTALCSAIAWGGAALLKPHTRSATHVSVLDMATAADGTTLVRARTWASVVMPEFGDVPVAVGVPEADDAATADERLHDTVSSAALEKRPDVGFVDPQAYTFPAADPDAMSVPARSTAKRLEADWMGSLDELKDHARGEWGGFRATLRVTNGLPVGTVSHSLPAPLTNVVVIYSSGRTGNEADFAAVPAVYWRYDAAAGNTNPQGDWPPGTIMRLPSPARFEVVRRPQPDYLPRGAKDPRPLSKLHLLSRIVLDNDRAWWFGDGPRPAPDPAQRSDWLIGLSFFDALPPPDFRDMEHPQDHTSLRRSLLAGLDWTHLLAGRRLIIIGHLENSELPMPLRVGGDTVPAEGQTMVRWVYDL